MRRAQLVLEQNPGTASIRRIDAHRSVINGLRVMTVRVDADVALIGILGRTELTVEGHALVEELR